MSVKRSDLHKSDTTPVDPCSSLGVMWFKRIWSLAAGFAQRPSQLRYDDSFDDNRDDCGTLDYVPYSPKMPYCAWSRLLPTPGSVGSTGSPTSRIAWLLSGRQAGSFGNKFGNKTW